MVVDLTATRFEVAGVKRFHELERAWAALADECRAPIFLHPAWIRAWQIHYAPDANVRLILGLDRDGRLIGLLPLARVRRALHSRLPGGLRTWVLAGSGPGAADHVGALAVDEGVLDGLFAAVPDVVGNAPLFLDGLPAAQEATAACRLGLHQLERRPAPALRWSNGSNPRSAGSKKLWQEIARMRRRLAELDVVGRWYGPMDDLDDVLGRLVDLHRDRWALQGEGGLLDGRKIDFFLELARLSPDGITGPWVYELRTADVPVGAILCLRTRSQIAFYQGGWAPDWGRYSLGKVMVAGAIDFAAEVGATTFDFLRGAESYKYRFGGVDQFDVVGLAGRGFSYELAFTREKLARRRRGRPPSKGTMA